MPGNIRESLDSIDPMPEALYTVAALLAVVAAVAWIAERVDLPLPILLVVAGIALALTPGLPSIELDPDIIMLAMGNMKDADGNTLLNNPKK